MISNRDDNPGSRQQPTVVGSVPIALPPMVPKQAYRPAQSNIPNDRAARDHLKALAAKRVTTLNLVPPLSLPELREHAAALRDAESLAPEFDDYIAVLLNNETWRDTLATIPYDRRLLLLPKCLRVEEHCPAPFDEFGLLCKECGLCSIQDFTVEAERLGYAVLVAEGSAIVRQMIETGKIEAVVGVSCLNVLDKSFPHLEAAAVPGIAIPLLQDDCVNCTVDLDWVWDVIHLSAADQTYRLDLDTLKREVKGWFTHASLVDLMGPVGDVTERVARDWLAGEGNRWRPYLATCVNLALACDGRTAAPTFDRPLRQLAVAIECFHKASLIHDDIEDGDLERYGQPTLHALFGQAVALNVGDFLLGEGYRLLAELDVSHRVRVSMLQAAAKSQVTLCRGQGTELAWARNPKPLTSLEVLSIFREKTVPAFEAALLLGAFLGDASKELCDVLRSFSDALGLAYQIKDDLEDFTEGESKDLFGLRPSLILAIAKKRARTDPEVAMLESLWRREADLAVVTGPLQQFLTERQVFAKAEDLLRAYEEQAIRSLRFLENATLKGLLRRVVGKIFPRTLIEGYCSEFEARNAPDRAARTAHAG